MLRRLCISCPATFEAKPGRSRCPDCQADRDRARDQRRGNARHRGYDKTYYRNRRKLLAQPGAACEMCGTTENLTADHIVPLSLGGTSDPWNLRVLCGTHNSARGNRPTISSPDIGPA